MNELVLFRNELNISQKEAANGLAVSLRTYQRYEKSNSLSKEKINAIKIVLNDIYEITETKGVLTIEKIRQKIVPILIKNKIELCILFGSYSKGLENESSDVDLLVKTDISGIKFLNLVEDLRVALHKKVDLITTKQLTTSNELLDEILHDGVKLYDQFKRQEVC